MRSTSLLGSAMLHDGEKRRQQITPTSISHSMSGCSLHNSAHLPAGSGMASVSANSPFGFLLMSTHRDLIVFGVPGENRQAKEELGANAAQTCSARAI